MTAIKNQHFIFLFLFIAIVLSGCNDKWEDHNQIQDPVLADNLLEIIVNNSDLSTFAGYLAATGYDEVIASSKVFTVWAPTNQALANLDPAIVNDGSLLKQFVANHISNQAYFTRNANPLLTIRTLNGKNVLFTKTMFEEANITAADLFTGNGVLHIVDMAIVPKLNAWEFLNNSAASLQKTFLQSQNYTYRDLSQAEIIGIDPKTGNPIYKEGTGYFSENYFLRSVTDLSNEDGKYTFVILTDAAFSAEKTKIAPFYTVSISGATPARNAFVTDSLTTWDIVKDLVFVGDYSVDNLPDTLISYDSLKVHLDKTAIVETHKVSNGVVYVMSSIKYKMSGKLKPVIIEGENYVAYTNAVPPLAAYANTNGTRSIRTRRNPYTNADFTEIYFSGHSTSAYWIHYLPTVNAVKYKVYWVAVRDFNTTGTITYFTQRVAFKDRTVVSIPYKQVDLLNYNEVYLGEYTPANYGALDTFLVSFTSTTNTLNSLVLDYIKMVPVTN
ncbi:MAG: fasciclin domain-containing protein [Bacteroidia bacterium]|nr:fasciclin domain-containing protein [Bacteroidia bacterium]